MEWRPGDRLRHLNLPDLGLGEVISVDGDKLRIGFQHGGERVFLASAPFEQVTGIVGPMKKIREKHRKNCDILDLPRGMVSRGGFAPPVRRR